MDDEPWAEELSEAQVEELRADMIALKDELDGQLVRGSDGAKTVGLDQPIGRLTRMDAMQQQQMAQDDRRRRELRRKQVVAALAALERGEYGLCRRCEEPIGYGRLKARPESPFCVGCMGALERR